jgi:hypothetical protein
MYRQATKYLLVLVTVLIAASGCQDLDVVNTNDPDRGRALQNPADLQALVGGGFNIWYLRSHSSSASNLFMNYATEFTSTTNVWGYWTEAQEPRGPHGNLVSIAAGIGPWGPRHFWGSMLEVASSADDLLRAVKEDNVVLLIDGVDQTTRAVAFAKFLQGLAWGYMSIIYDQTMVIPETGPFPITVEEGVENLRPASEALTMALAALDEAKSLAQTNQIVFPSRSASNIWFGTPTEFTSPEFVRLINTIQARLIVLNARTPAERAQVDWNRILQLTAAGLTEDFEIQLDATRADTLYLQAQDETPGCLSCYRWDNRLIGQADISGAYQAWVQAPLTGPSGTVVRTRFNITTPDRRITGPSPTSAGAYTRWLSSDGAFQASRQPYFRSAYQWRRHAHRQGLSALRETGFNQGLSRIATVDENNLFRAEALYYTGDLAGAAELINITRTRSHTLPDGVTYPGLPPVTADGVPQSDDCVPRTDSGACGNLLVALRYERMIENAGLDAIRGWADSRAFGLLPDGSYYELPIPANELDAFGMQLYTFGGVGQAGGATYAPVGNP